MSPSQDRSSSRMVFPRVFLAAGTWLVLAFLLLLPSGRHVIAPGDFDYSLAMDYHAFMVPLLAVACLLALQVFEALKDGRLLFAVLSLAVVALAGPASLARSSPGMNLVALVQIAGMALADLLVFLTLLALLREAFLRPERLRDGAFWLLAAALGAILLAAPMGHLAGWGVDLDLRAFPGVPSLLAFAGLSPESFQDALVGGHSHLIVVSLLTALVALAAQALGFSRLRAWPRSLALLGIWATLLGLAAAAIIYFAAVLLGWEPPTILVSGPSGENGIPLDDVMLTLCGLGWLLVAVACAVGAPPEAESLPGPSPAGDSARSALPRLFFVANIAAGLLAVVALGFYIELHEVFFGGGEPPAPGAAADQAFIRAHLIYAYFSLPLLLVLFVALVSAPQSTSRPAFPLWDKIFLWVGLATILVGLFGEYLWVFTLKASLMGLALLLLLPALLLALLALASRLHTIAR